MLGSNNGQTNRSRPRPRVAAHGRTSSPRAGRRRHEVSQARGQPDRREVTVRTGGIAGILCGRWTKWGMLGVWLLLAMALGPLAGNLAGVQKNDLAQWLPDDAESTQVFALERSFQPADLAKVEADARKLAGVDGIAGPVVGPVPAQDGQALQLIIPIAMGSDDQAKVVDRADAIRGIAEAGSNGLAVHLTGPIAFAADTSEAFLGIDTTLLFATVAVVVILLLIIYRSPVLWLLPVITAGLALVVAQAVIYLLAKHADLPVNGQSAGIMTVLVFGASTDYALLLIARYREGLRRQQDRHAAMAEAVRRSGPAIIASAATVTVGMLCLLIADMRSTKGLGPVAAVAIVVGLLATLSLLPALLVIFGRWLFWPATPKLGSTEPSAGGAWARLGRRIARRPRGVWVVTALVLGAMALGLAALEANGLSFKDSFVDKPRSIVGEEVMDKHFPAGQGQPVVVIGKEAAASQLRQAVASTQGIAAVSDPVTRNGLARLEATLQAQPGTAAADATILGVREAVHAIEGADAKVGGLTAMNLDMSRANSHDNRLIIPLVLLAVLVILAVLLRAIVAPLVLIATVVLSFAAALGVSSLVFKYVFGFAGADSAFPLDVFVFLVALGIDYNIFLMTRVREESLRLGTRRGALAGLAVTGGVITSAGLVLAATFSVLATLPLVFITELGFAVALGVLIDTFIVRSVLVTALTLDIGRWMWWPSKLAGRRDVSNVELGTEATPELVS